MLQRKDPSGMISEEFRNGVDDFIRIATRDPTNVDVEIVIGRHHLIWRNICIVMDLLIVM